jgi:hypothetical protein
VVLQLTVFWYIGAVLGHVCLGLGVLALVTMLLSWVFFFPQWGLGVCVVLWSVGCKSIQFLVHSFKYFSFQVVLASIQKVCKYKSVLVLCLEY